MDERPKWDKAGRIMLGFTGAFFLALMFAVPILEAVSGRGSSVSQTDPISRMSQVFMGGPYSRADIRREVEPIMAGYGIANTRENIDRLGGVLTKLRTDTGAPELLTLRCMRGGIGASATWTDMAAFCAHFIKGASGG